LEDRERRAQIWVQENFDLKGFEKILAEKFSGVRVECGDRNKEHAKECAPGYQLLDICIPETIKDVTKLCLFLDSHEVIPKYSR